jgi:hypothetical protein
MKRYQQEALGHHSGFANQAPPKKYVKQTIKVGDVELKIVSAVITRNANFMGWNVVINGEKLFSNNLKREDAVNSAVERYKKKHNLK